MGLKLEIWRGDEDYLLVAVTGEYSLSGFKELVRRTRFEAREQGIRRLMIDLTRVRGDIERWEGEHLGAYVILSSEHRLKCAIVMTTTDVARAFQNAVRGQDMKPRVFSDRESALEWLLRGRS